jgi:hypothetical protein
MQKFINQKEYCIQNYVGKVRTRSLSYHKNNDTLTHFEKLKGHEFINRIKSVFQQKGF